MKAPFSGVSEKVKTPLQSRIPRKLTSHDSPQIFYLIVTIMRVILRGRPEKESPALCPVNTPQNKTSCSFPNRQEIENQPYPRPATYVV